MLVRVTTSKGLTKMKKKSNRDDSDEFDVDEPEEFKDSGSDWDLEEEVIIKKKNFFVFTCFDIVNKN